MPATKSTGPFAKREGETARDHMLRLRKEFPKKFGRQPGPNKNPTRKFTKLDIAAAEKRGAEKAAKKIAAESKIDLPPVLSQTPAAQPAAVVDTSPPAAGEFNSATLPDTEIFGSETPPPPKLAEGSPTPPPPPPPGSDPAPPPQASAQDENSVAKYAMMIWGMIVTMCCAVFGDGFQPQVMKSATGEVLYDEAKEAIRVWTNYLITLGVTAFSPIVELWIFLSMYFGLRIGIVINRFRRKKPGMASAKPEDQKKPEEKSSAEKPKPAEPEPAPAKGPGDVEDGGLEP